MQTRTADNVSTPPIADVQPTIHFIADVTQHNIDSAIKPHRLRLVNLIMPNYTPPHSITVGSKIHLNIIEDAVSPTDNAFPCNYYAFESWILRVSRAGQHDCDFIIVGMWRGVLEIATLTARVSFVDPNELPSLQQVGNTRSKWVSEEHQQILLEHLHKSSNDTRLAAIEVAIKGLRSRACMYGPDWTNFFGHH
ncbi:hypothetical protein QCA50_012642 [Cerrena zonata]|uniref:Uncharacterized protein n=1 Tax=Cerrena zonata TaxID=2478898 RepID=A0AAW0G314_9APHY